MKVLRLKDELTQLRKEVERLNKEINKFKEENKKLISELEEVRQKKDNELAILIEENQSLRLRISELEDQLHTQQQMTILTGTFFFLSELSLLHFTSKLFSLKKCCL
jgi:predicted RNase H-like nuclease (RuvC/YqgF family)